MATAMVTHTRVISGFEVEDVGIQRANRDADFLHIGWVSRRNMANRHFGLAIAISTGICAEVVARTWRWN